MLFVGLFYNCLGEIGKRGTMRVRGNVADIVVVTRKRDEVAT
jgi:hypothetical protein